MRKLLDKFFPKCERCGTRWHDNWGELECSLRAHLVETRNKRIALQAQIDADKSLEPKRLMER